MNIEDFNGSATPVAVCTDRGAVCALNPAARSRLPQLHKGKKLPCTPGILHFPFGRCFCVPDGERFFLLFCDFLSFELEEVLFPTAEEVMACAGGELLHLAAECSRFSQDAGDAVRLSRIRSMLYDRFSFVFTERGNPTRFYRPQTFFRLYQSAALRGYRAIGAHVSFDCSLSDGDCYLNARNAAVLLTALCSALLSRTRDARCRVNVCNAGQYVCVALASSLVCPIEPMRSEQDLTRLAPYFPEYAVDLCAAQICVQTCDYAVEYDVDDTGRIEVRLYLKTETDLYALFDPAALPDPTDAIADLIIYYIRKSKK